MIDHLKVRQSLRSRLMSMPGMVPEAQVAPENRNFTPPQVPTVTPDKDRRGLLWVRDTLIPISTTTAASATDLFQGYIQFDVFYPSGLGTELPEQLASKIMAHFRPPKTLSFKDCPPVKVYKVDRSQGLDLGELHVEKNVWYQIPVFVYFRVYDVQPIEAD